MKKPTNTRKARHLLLAALLIASAMGLPACSGWEASTYSYSNLPKNSSQDQSW